MEWSICCVRTPWATAPPPESLVRYTGKQHLYLSAQCDTTEAPSEGRGMDACEAGVTDASDL
jgi:hypothetical protein